MRELLLCVLLTAAPDPRPQIREALVAGDLPRARVVAAPWAQGTPPERACLVELLEADGRSKEAQALKRALPPPPPVVTPPGAAPKLAGTAWVAASSLTLRAGPAPDAAVLARLPIGAEVQVLAVQEAFAKVRTSQGLRPPRVLAVSAGDHGYVVKPLLAAAQEGWVATAFLAAAPPDVAALEKQAAGGGLAALERLAGLKRTPELWARLAGAAFDAGRCGVAANAATELARGKRALSGYTLDALRLVYRCRGDLARAVLFTPTDAQLKKKRVPRDACVVDVDPQPDCGFCPLAYDDEASPEAKRDLAASERREAARKARFAAIHALFPKGPFLRLQVRRTSGAVEPLVVVTVSELGQACGEYPEPQQLERLSLQLPDARTGEALDLWLEVAAYEAHGFEVGAPASFAAAIDAHEAAVTAWKKTYASDTPAFSGGLGWRVDGPPLVNCCCD